MFIGHVPYPQKAGTMMLSLYCLMDLLKLLKAGIRDLMVHKHRMASFIDRN